MTARSRTLRCLAIGALLALTSTVTAQSTVSGRTLDGAWNVTVVFDQQGLLPCAPAGAVFTVLTPGSGTVIAESCYASEGAGYGSWMRTGDNRFAATFIGNSFGPDGTVATTYKVRARVALGPSRDTFSGPFTTEFFDLAGNVLGMVTGPSALLELLLNLESVQASTRLAEHIVTPSGEGRIAVPGGRVLWRRFGSGGGIPLLVVHGGPGLTSSYLESFAALSDTRHVVIWDQLDCGRSDCPGNPVLWRLERFVEELDIVRKTLTPGPVHILGHSWGSTLVMEWLVTRTPSAVASVIFASPCLSTPRWIEDTRTLVAQLSPRAQAAIAEAERTGDFRSSGYQTAASGEWMRAHIVRTLPAEAVESLVGSLVAVNANLEMLEYMWGPSDFTVTGPLKNFDRTSDLSGLTMPVLFHCGEFDEACPETVREHAALTPNAEVAIIPGAGHLTMIDAPEQANAAIRMFLGRVEKEAGTR